SPCGTSPIASPVAGLSAVNVSPVCAPTHAPSMSIPRSGTAWNLVVELVPDQVADRQDADELSAVLDRQVAEAAVNHHGGGVTRRVGRLDRLRMSRHQRFDVALQVAGPPG